MKMRLPTPLGQVLEKTLWPEIIDCYELGHWVQLLHHYPQDFDEGNLLERIHQHDQYKLTEVPIERLDPDEWAVHDHLLEKYRGLDGKAPPIIIDEHDSIIDGTHRVNVALAQGKNHIWAYVPA